MRLRRRQYKRQLKDESIYQGVVEKYLSHDGKAVVLHEGKATFVEGGLPNETIKFRLTSKRRHFNEGQLLSFTHPNEFRVEPQCPVYEKCGGCSLQHLDSGRQILEKQRVLEQNIHKISKLDSVPMVSAICGPVWRYRRRARLAVRYLAASDKVIVGFRERHGKEIAECSDCLVLDNSMGLSIEEIAGLIGTLDCKPYIPQVEVVVLTDTTALLVRHMRSISQQDREILQRFSAVTATKIFLQSAGPNSVVALDDSDVRLSYTIDAHQIQMEFRPNDFIQVNSVINDKMINKALELLELQRDDCVLDLFSGLGNFTLPIAVSCEWVRGVEGDDQLIDMAKKNALANQINNTDFIKADLFDAAGSTAWLDARFTKALIDPPRSGAKEIMVKIKKSNINHIVYVSCHPGSLARDIGLLVHELGFSLQSCGVMDMFPQTSHVESIAVLKK